VVVGSLVPLDPPHSPVKCPVTSAPLPVPVAVQAQQQCRIPRARLARYGDLSPGVARRMCAVSDAPTTPPVPEESSQLRTSGDLPAATPDIGAAMAELARTFAARAQQ